MNVPEKYRVVTDDILKWIALATMAIDHVAASVVKGYVAVHMDSITPEELKRLDVAYSWMRNIGRTAFPLIAFFLVQGFMHSKNRRRYLGRLLLFALLSEIPFDLAIYHEFFYPGCQNTIFTLVIGFLVLEGFSYVSAHCRYARWINAVLQLGICGCGALAAFLCKTDYSYKGITLILIFFLSYYDRISGVIAGFLAFCWEPWCFPAFLLILFGNGRRSGRAKFFFYIFYPVHLLLFHLIFCILK